MRKATATTPASKKSGARQSLDMRAAASPQPIGTYHRALYTGGLIDGATPR